MKKKDTMDTLFKDLEGSFDVHETPSGHQARFLEKLHLTEEAKAKRTTWWKPLSIAASILILIAVGFSVLGTTQKQENDLASVSPEMEKTQQFFTTTINKELATLQTYETAETKALVTDALKQLTILETEYETLKTDLIESGNDKRVIYAMIANFQNRIDLLQRVIETIEEVKQLKNNKNEITL